MIHRSLVCFITLLILATFTIINVRIFWCSLCSSSGFQLEPLTITLGHHGRNSELKLIPKLWNHERLPYLSRKQSVVVKKKKQFLYVTQTESCLPQHFLRHDQLGTDGNSFDILVLSWKTRCPGLPSRHPNLKYIYAAKNTTWSTGRNLLFSHILRQGVDKYLYYIFMDDDVMLYHTEPYQVFHKQYPSLNNRLSHVVVEKYLKFHSERIQRGDNPYREFERFLIEFEPAVGLLNFCFERRAYCMSQYVPDVWQAFCSSEGMVPFPYVSYSNFDGAFNAFHRDAITHLLPYHVTYDHVNWQESQKYLILEADIKFQGQVLYDLLITGHGTLHRPYPRNIHWHANWPKVLRDLRMSIDKKYQNEIEVLPLEISKRRFDEIRNPLPPQAPIVPFRHYGMNRTRTCHHSPRMYKQPVIIS